MLIWRTKVNIAGPGGSEIPIRIRQIGDAVGMGGAVDVGIGRAGKDFIPIENRRCLIAAFRTATGRRYRHMPSAGTAVRAKTDGRSARVAPGVPHMNPDCRRS